MPKLTDEQIARAYGYAAALQDRGGVDGQVGTAFLEVMQAYVEQRDALAQADALAAENARWRDGAFTLYEALLLVANRTTTLASANARLRDALLDTQQLAWQLEHDGPRYYERKQSPYGEYLKCMYCGEISADAGEFRHTEKCPVRRLYEMKDARALLDVGA